MCMPDTRTYADRADYLKKAVSERRKKLRAMSLEYGGSKCQICGYIYDPAQGDPDNHVPPNTPFEKLPEEWVCPICGATQDQFQAVD